MFTLYACLRLITNAQKYQVILPGSDLNSTASGLEVRTEMTFKGRLAKFKSDFSAYPSCL